MTDLAERRFAAMQTGEDLRPAGKLTPFGLRLVYPVIAPMRVG